MLQSRPWHLMPLAIIAAAWFAIGAVDYLLIRFGAEFYLDRFTPDQASALAGLPVPVGGAWAAGVWAGLLAAIQLARRGRGAALLFAVSTLGLAVVTAALALPSGRALGGLAGVEPVWLMLAASGVSALFWLYTRLLHQRGTLP